MEAQRYVAVANHDSGVDRAPDMESPPMVYETYLNDATLEAAQARLRVMDRHNGGGRIALLDFELDGDPGEPHVIVASHDGVHPDRGPLVWEHYIGAHTTREAVNRSAAGLERRYGACRIARLVFAQEPA
jgi:hypothetical protein